jgi:hypothetical protein
MSSLPNQDAAKWSSTDAVSASARTRRSGSTYSESTCAWLSLVPQHAIVCELRELNKQMAYFIEKMDKQQVTERK